MAEYRRRGQRFFMKVEGSIVTSVLNREKSASISMYDSAMMADGILNDSKENPAATEQEFNEAFKEARDRILLDRL